MGASREEAPVQPPLTLRPLAAQEADAVGRLARSRSAPARAVERARIVELAHQGRRVPAIARELGVCEATVRTWLKRFSAAGLDALADAPRAGRPPTYTPEEVGEVVAASLTDPQALGLPFASWTLDRLAAYLAEEQGIPIKRSRIGEILVAEGLRWREQETWFGERPDPAFAAKRGRSSPSTRRHRPGP
jgi:transposase